ncbi:MAG: hypothetical protein ACRD2C_09895 [Acidimicrobiales bacterium]
MTRQYREAVALPDDLDLAGISRLWCFVHSKVTVNCELVHFDTGDSAIREASLDRAVAELDGDEEVASVELVVFTHRDDFAVALKWQRGGEACLEVAGTDEAYVLGVGAVMRRFIERRRYEVSTQAPVTSPPDDRTHTVVPRFLEWLNDLSVQVVGTVLGALALGVLGVLWAVLH